MAICYGSPGKLIQHPKGRALFHLCGLSLFSLSASSEVFHISFSEIFFMLVEVEFHVLGPMPFVLYFLSGSSGPGVGTHPLEWPQGEP